MGFSMVPTRVASRGLMSKTSTPSALPRSSKRSIPVACSRLWTSAQLQHTFQLSNLDPADSDRSHRHHPNLITPQRAYKFPGHAAGTVDIESTRRTARTQSVRCLPSCHLRAAEEDRRRRRGEQRPRKRERPGPWGRQGQGGR